MYFMRFIHKDLERNQLPVRWSYPEAGLFSGCQVLDIEEGLKMSTTGEHLHDDFFSQDCYSHVCILKVSGCSGQKGPLRYNSIVEGDIESMHVLEFSDSDFGWSMMEIALELIEEGADIDLGDDMMPLGGWWEDHIERVVEGLIDASAEVEPVFVDTLEGRC